MFQCGSGFLSSFNLDAPICSKCIQKAKSLDSTIDYDKVYNKCGMRGGGVIYGKEMCHSSCRATTQIDPYVWFYL